MKLSEIAPIRALNPETGNNEGEHALIFGMTGFGKTYLAKRLSRLRKYVTIHDAKGTFREPGFVRFTSLSKLIKSKAFKTIYAPSRFELRDEKAQDAYFEYIYARGNTTAIIDELTAVATTRHDIPDALFDCYARGREFGNEIWALTQEPVFVPSIALTQARHRYTFYLTGPTHQKKVVDLMPGLTIDDVIDLGKREFYYYREGEKTVDERGPFHLGKNLSVG